MGAPNLETKLARIAECASNSNHDDLSRSLLHAYTACFSIVELTEAAVRTIDAPLDTRRAVLTRLARVGREGGNQELLDQLGERTMALPVTNAKSRTRIDALLSQLYAYFSPPIRQAILERWQSRGTKGAGARWLKALSNDDLQFNLSDILVYWRATGDVRAAKLLAYRSDPTLLSEILPELVRDCDEGWIISRAALDAEAVSEKCWAVIRSKFPASYTYLCAKTGRALGKDEALMTVVEAGATWPSNERGLAIWAIGQLGMWSVLETIRGMAPDLRNADLARIGVGDASLDGGS